MTFDTLLVPTDGSRPAEVAAHRAFALAEALGATAHLLSVADARLATHAAASATRVRERLRDQARAQASSLEDVAAAYDVTAVSAVREGVPAEEIVEHARDNALDCIVLGSYGRGDFERLAVGSVADAVVRTAPMPVVTVPSSPDEEPGPTAPFERLLLPTDGSEHAEAAARRGLDLAAALEASVHLLTVADTALERRLPQLFADSEPGRERDAVPDDHFASLAADADDRGVDATTAVRSGTPATEILAAAREHDADGIVIGTRGRGGVRRLLLGSVATRVVHASPVPVVTVRSGDA